MAGSETTATARSAAANAAPGLCCAPLSTAPLSDGDAVELAVLFKALADPVRLKLVSVIAAAGEGCACDFPELTGKSQPTVSHHLKLLTDAGILEREQRGKWAWFSLNEDRLAQIQAALG